MAKVIGESTVQRDGQTFTVTTLRPQKGRTKQQIRLSSSFRCRGPKTSVDKSAKVGLTPIFGASPAHARPSRKTSGYVNFEG